METLREIVLWIFGVSFFMVVDGNSSDGSLSIKDSKSMRMV